MILVQYCTELLTTVHAIEKGVRPPDENLGSIIGVPARELQTEFLAIPSLSERCHVTD
jgi:hypothetical protein